MSNDEHWLVKVAKEIGLIPEGETKPRAIDPNGATIAAGDPAAEKWCGAALEAVCGELRATQEGARADMTYRKAFRVGTLVAGGYLDEADAFDAVTDAARATGLPDREIERAITNGFAQSQHAPALLQLDDDTGTTLPAYTLDAPEIEGEVSSWSPMDLSQVLDGTYRAPQAGVLFRDDGQGLLYPGHVHWLHGESESGKSWVAQYAAACVLETGGRVLYIDHESNPSEIVGRLLAMGVGRSDIAERFDYVRPEVPARTAAEDYAALLGHDYALAVVDGVTDAVGLDGVTSKDNDEVAGWMRRIPHSLARHTGAAVACIDHVSKDTEGRGRFAIGGQHKMAGVDGAAYLVEPVEPLGQGTRGSLVMRVAKDRPGSVRPACGRYNKVNRLQEAARVVIDSTKPGITAVTVGAPEEPLDPQTGEFRPTELMERISRVVENAPNGASFRQIKFAVVGQDERLREAVKMLVKEGYVELDIDPNKTTHRSIKPFRRTSFEETG